MHFLSLVQFLALIPIILPFPSSSKTYTSLNQGSSLSCPGDVLVSSPTGIFTAGFFPVGENAYCFAIWFAHVLADGNSTVVWMANRDQPLNGRNTKLSLLGSGNLVLKDAGRPPLWTSGTKSASSVQLQLDDYGNLVLRDRDSVTIWQSFDSPTNTLLPRQLLTKNAKLISSRSPTNYSSGLYKLYFDDDSILRLLYDGPERRSVFWPSPWLTSWAAGRFTYNTSKIAMLDVYGNFVSTDDFQFQTSDLGVGPQRRMTLDPDGLVRVYSLNKYQSIWEVTWQLDLPPCKVHGICGSNSLCTYSRESGRRCSCLPGYRIKNHRDWSKGCVPEFNGTGRDDDHGFLKLDHTEFYGSDIKYFENKTLQECERLCLSYSNCQGYQYSKTASENSLYSCFPKTLLLNGYQSPASIQWAYIRLPKHVIESSKMRSAHKFELQCSSQVMQIDTVYQKKHEYAWLKSLTWCVAALGAIELICLLIFLCKTRLSSSTAEQGYFQVATGFKSFTYAELKKASRNFSEEIGRGGSGVVYKGILSDKRVAAIKCLNEANQGEAEFLAEVGTIGRLNHANLIERWGYCADGKHRILVYEYLENGSLAENLHSHELDWRKRFDIALGTAKGLAYLHEECLEWVLHCDVKPHNILLDSDYQPKVADFGLSKQVNRGSAKNMNVSAIRGTRGYMAPEWVYNLPITAKVDVYSYGIVVLEMVTGKSPKVLNVHSNNGGILDQKRLKDLVAEIDEEPLLSCIEQIVDPGLMAGEYDLKIMENLVKVALHCIQENRDARPTMTQVVDILLGQGAGNTLGRKS